jgi:hypothetical protein
MLVLIIVFGIVNSIFSTKTMVTLGRINISTDKKSYLIGEIVRITIYYESIPHWEPIKTVTIRTVTIYDWNQGFAYSLIKEPIKTVAIATLHFSFLDFILCEVYDSNHVLVNSSEHQVWSMRGIINIDWKPFKPDVYTIKAYYLVHGDEVIAKDSISIKVNKAESAISISYPKSIKKGESITVLGLVYSSYPINSRIIVTLTYKKPNGLIITRYAITDLEGKFSDTYSLDMAGLWSVLVSWEGDEYHEGFTSKTVQFKVEEEPIQPPELPLTPSTQSTQKLLVIPQGIFFMLIATGITTVLAIALGLRKKQLLSFIHSYKKPSSKSFKSIPLIKNVFFKEPSFIKLDDKVFDYIVKHKGTISLSKACKDLGISIEELKASIERLKHLGKLEEAS